MKHFVLFVFLALMTAGHCTAQNGDDPPVSAAEAAINAADDAKAAAEEAKSILGDIKSISAQKPNRDEYVNDSATGFVSRATRCFGTAFSNQFEVIQVDIFAPKYRVYLFDLGTDDDGEIDVFSDGSAVPVINLIEANFLNTLGDDRIEEYDGVSKVKPGTFLFGLNAGVGLSAPATVNPDDMGMVSESPSKAPVILLSSGLVGQYRPLSTTDLQIGLEVGIAYGISADENFRDTDDSAVYVGFTVTVGF